MKKINIISSSILWMFAICMTFFSCSEKEDGGLGNIEKGHPVSISFELTTPVPAEVETRASDVQETRVEKLALFFFKASDPDSKPLYYEVTDLTEVNTSNSTNYTYNITVPTSVGLTSDYWYIYAVANWDKGFWDSGNQTEFESLKQKTRAEMDAFCILKTHNETDFIENSLLLTGRYGDGKGQNVSDGKEAVRLDWDPNRLEPGKNTLSEPIHLKRSVAKINFEFINGNGVKFVPETYDIYNYSLSSTLLERTAWGNKGVADPGSMEYMGKGAFTSNINNITIDNPQKNSNYSFMFYMPENVQKAKANPGSKLMRELKEGANFKYAPQNATYVVIHGKYEGPGKNGNGTVTANVDYTIFLGDFSKTGSADNFTVRRNTKYTFKVTVQGVNNIITEAEAQGEPQPGAEGDVVNTNADNKIVVDAHYETRIIKIKKSELNSSSQIGFVLRTPKDVFVSNNINSAELKDRDINWVHFCKPASENTYVSYMHAVKEGGLVNVGDFLNNLKTPTSYSKNFVESADGNYLYVQVFVDEYFYNNLKLYQFVNAADRIMTLATNTHVSADKHSTYTETPIFSIQQKSIKTMYDLSQTNASLIPFGVETVEDRLDSDKPISDKHVSLLLGGSGDYADGADTPITKENGYANCKLYLNKLGITKWSQVIDFANNCMLDNSSKRRGKNYKEYGILAFLLRNRDLNADDIIDDNEIKWYTPSLNQHIAIWNGIYALPEEAKLNKGKLYFTSTNSVYRILWAPEGAFGPYGFSDADDKGYALVRCARTLDDAKYNQATTASTNYADFVYTVSNFGPNAVRESGSVVGAYNYHIVTASSNKLPTKFRVAKNYLTGVGGKLNTEENGERADLYSISDIQNRIKELCNSYYEEPDGSDRGTWRIPNERELSVMLLLSSSNKGRNIKAHTASCTWFNGYDYDVRNEDTGIFYITDRNFITSQSTDNNGQIPADRKWLKLILIRDVVNK